MNTDEMKMIEEMAIQEVKMLIKAEYGIEED